MYEHVDEGTVIDGARSKQVEKARGDYGTAEYPVGRIQLGQKTTRDLGDEVAPEEGRIDRALRGHRPVAEGDRRVVSGFQFGHAHVAPHTERYYETCKELFDFLENITLFCKSLENTKK